MLNFVANFALETRWVKQSDAYDGEGQNVKNDRRGHNSVLHGPHGPWVWMLVTTRWKRFKEKRGSILLMVQKSGVHQLRYVVFPIICRVFFVQDLGGWPELGTINSIKPLNRLRMLQLREKEPRPPAAFKPFAGGHVPQLLATVQQECQGNRNKHTTTATTNWASAMHVCWYTLHTNWVLIWPLSVRKTDAAN